MTSITAPSDRIGVIIAQLGTPDAPTATALRPYLRQFLSDMRVIDYSPFVWQPLLRGIILNTRPRKSARLYSRIWMDEGSPLMVYSERQMAGLQARLGERFRVVLGMTYGNPSMGSALDTLAEEGIERIVVFPMFPQFSSTTTASVYDAVYRAAAGRRCPLFHERKRAIPTLRFVPPYYDHPSYINAMAEHLRGVLQGLEAPPDQIIFSFHGIPQRYARTGDPYPAQCAVTAEHLAGALGLAQNQWRQTFQSRFGPEEWLQPYTDETLEHLPHEGHANVLIFSPGFVADCLETLDELGNEGREQFAEGGGDPEKFTFAACLNDHPCWLDTMAEIVTREAAGWANN
ncbi:MAG: ferrochelatase [Anaerolineae bacterium]|nr:ferrochelatase [Anaerolineae bacterium]